MVTMFEVVIGDLVYTVPAQSKGRAAEAAVNAYRKTAGLSPSVSVLCSSVREAPKPKVGDVIHTRDEHLPVVSVQKGAVTITGALVGIADGRITVRHGEHVTSVDMSKLVERKRVRV